MTSSSVRMRLLVDQNVPLNVVEFFRYRGHEVLLSRDVFEHDSPDRLLAIGAAIDGLGRPSLFDTNYRWDNPTLPMIAMR